MINHVVLMEEFQFGERVREFLIEGWDGSGWIPLKAGHHVGRKHIAVFDPVVVSKLRLRVLRHAATPLIRRFSAHHVSGHQPKTEAAIRDEWKQIAAWTPADFNSDRARLDINLAGSITEAGQWELQFLPAKDTDSLKLSDGILLQQGQESVVGALSRKEGKPNTYNINRTAVVTEDARIRFQVTVSGSRSGVVLLRRTW